MADAKGQTCVSCPPTFYQLSKGRWELVPFPEVPGRAILLWLVGQDTFQDENGYVWDFQGIFDSEQAAIDACRTDAYFVAPVVLNQSLPHETIPWTDSYYPHQRSVSDGETRPETQADASQAGLGDAQESDSDQ